MAKMNGSWRWIAGGLLTVLTLVITTGTGLHLRAEERIGKCEANIARIDERSISVDNRLTRIELKLDRLLERGG